MTNERASDSSRNLLHDLINSHRVTAVIYVAARLGIADLLSDGPQTTAELARQAGAHERSLRRLLRALVSLGLCKLVGQDQFALTEIGAHLAASSEGSQKEWVMWEGQYSLGKWEGLFESIQTGKTAAQLAGFENAFQQMAQESQEVRVFNDAMVSLTSQVAPGVVAAYDFSTIKYLIDVGGGHGELISGILRANPLMRGAIFDLSRCAAGANELLTQMALSNRCEFIAGDFFVSVPGGADALIMKSIIHNWNDERGAIILRNCHQALRPNSLLILVERIVPEVPEINPEHRDVAMSDLNMLRIPGGAERTASEYRELLAKSGFKMARVVAAGRFSVIEAVCA